MSGVLVPSRIMFPGLFAAMQCGHFSKSLCMGPIVTERHGGYAFSPFPVILALSLIANWIQCRNQLMFMSHPFCTARN